MILMMMQLGPYGPCMGNMFVGSASLSIGQNSSPDFLRVSGGVQDSLNHFVEGTLEMLGTMLGSGIL